MAMLLFPAKWLGAAILGDPDIEGSNRLFRLMEQYYKLAWCFANLPSGGLLIPGLFVSHIEGLSGVIEWRVTMLLACTPGGSGLSRRREYLSRYSSIRVREV